MIPQAHRFAAVAAAVMITIGVGGCAKAMAIDDATVTKYIAAYKGLKAASPALAAQLGKNDVTPAAGQEGFAAIDGVVKQAGFANYAEFVKANAAIGLAFSQVQAGAFMGDMESMQKTGTKKIQSVLDNPSVPESTKAELRAQMTKNIETYKQNKGLADKVMAWVGWANDPDTVAVVTRHRAELQAVFSSR